MKKKLFSLLLFYFLLFNTLTAQNIGINGTGANPHASALLDIDASATPSLGILIPRVALQATSLALPVTSPATSLLIYNTASVTMTPSVAVTPGYYYWDAIKWVKLSTSNDWGLTGNINTNPSTNYIGTSDVQDLVIKTSNTERLRVLSGGNIGIGTTAPTASLHIKSNTINNGFRLEDGSQGNGKVLIGDANGNGSWQNIASITSAVLGNRESPFYNLLDTIDKGLWEYYGYSITLPAGKWILTVNIGVEPIFPQFTDSTYIYPSMVLSTSKSAHVATGFTNLLPWSFRGREVKNQNGKWSQLMVITGVYMIQTTATTTLYLGSETVNAGVYFNCPAKNCAYISDNNNRSSIYAIPIN